MPRSIREKVDDWQWWFDQVLHAIAGGAISTAVNLIALVDPELIGPFMQILGTFLGGSAGSLREILQNFRDDPATNDIVDSHIDSWAWLLGAFAVSMSFAF